MVGGRTKLYVGNLPELCKREDLIEKFSKYGRVEECDIVKNFGFVHMSNEEESRIAIQALNGSDYSGMKITVEASHSKVRPKPGMGGKGQCYRCGKSGHWSKECPRNANSQSNHRSQAHMSDRYNYNLHHPPHSMQPPAPSSIYPDRYEDPYASRYGPIRYGQVDRYERSYGRPYGGDSYERRSIPPPREGDYYYRRTTINYDDYAFRRTPPMSSVSTLPPAQLSAPQMPLSSHLPMNRMDRFDDRRYFEDRFSSYASAPPQAQASLPPPSQANRREPVY